MARVGGIGWLGGAPQLGAELEPDRHADEHGHAVLLGDEGADRALALARLLDRGDPADLRQVRAVEPAALGQRVLQDALQARGGVRDDLLRVGEALGRAQRHDGGVHLVGREPAVRHAAAPYEKRWVVARGGQRSARHRTRGTPT